MHMVKRTQLRDSSWSSQVKLLIPADIGWDTYQIFDVADFGLIRTCHARIILNMRITIPEPIVLDFE